MPKHEYDIVYVRDLVLQMSAGIYDHEKAAKQRVIINLEMSVEKTHIDDQSSIDDVVSYEDIVVSIRDIAARKHYELLEEFTEEISKVCLLDKRVKTVAISVEKPDIFEDCNAVGIKITRNQ